MIEMYLYTCIVLNSALLFGGRISNIVHIRNYVIVYNGIIKLLEAQLKHRSNIVFKIQHFNQCNAVVFQ